MISKVYKFMEPNVEVASVEGNPVDAVKLALDGYSERMMIKVFDKTTLVYTVEVSPTDGQTWSSPQRQDVPKDAWAGLIRRAIELLQGGWHKGTAARAIGDDKVSPISPAACSFCLVGATLRACFEKGHSPLTLNNYLEEDLQGVGLITFNDARDTTLDDVLGLLKRRLESLGEV